jgi:hypothetical protein
VNGSTLLAHLNCSKQRPMASDLMLDGCSSRWQGTTPQIMHETLHVPVRGAHG